MVLNNEGIYFLKLKFQLRMLLACNFLLKHKREGTKLASLVLHILYIVQPMSTFDLQYSTCSTYIKQYRTQMKCTLYSEGGWNSVILGKGCMASFCLYVADFCIKSLIWSLSCSGLTSFNKKNSSNVLVVKLNEMISFLTASVKN